MHAHLSAQVCIKLDLSGIHYFPLPKSKSSDIRKNKENRPAEQTETFPAPCTGIRTDYFDKHMAASICLIHH